VVIRPEAEAELQEAFDWYESRRVGLGEAFLSCVEAAVASAARDPEMHQTVHGAMRRVLTRRFPYGVFFAVEPERLVILAVFHGHRNPAELMRRIGKQS